MTVCLFCGVELTPARTGRPPRYCSTACRQDAYRLRRTLPRLRAARRFWAQPIPGLVGAGQSREVTAKIDREIQIAVSSRPGSVGGKRP